MILSTSSKSWEKTLLGHPGSSIIALSIAATSMVLLLSTQTLEQSLAVAISFLLVLTLLVINVQHRRAVKNTKGS